MDVDAKVALAAHKPHGNARLSTSSSNSQEELVYSSEEDGESSQKENDFELEDMDAIPVPDIVGELRRSSSPILDSPAPLRSAAPGPTELDQETIRCVLRDAIAAGHQTLPLVLPTVYARVATRMDYDRAINAIRSRNHIRQQPEGWTPWLTEKPFESLSCIFSSSLLCDKCSREPLDSRCECDCCYRVFHKECVDSRVAQPERDSLFYCHVCLFEQPNIVFQHRSLSYKERRDAVLLQSAKGPQQQRRALRLSDSLDGPCISPEEGEIPMRSSKASTTTAEAPTSNIHLASLPQPTSSEASGNSSSSSSSSSGRLKEKDSEARSARDTEAEAAPRSAKRARTDLSPSTEGTATARPAVTFAPDTALIASKPRNTDTSSTALAKAEQKMDLDTSAPLPLAVSSQSSTPKQELLSSSSPFQVTRPPPLKKPSAPTTPSALPLKPALKLSLVTPKAIAGTPLAKSSGKSVSPDKQSTLTTPPPPALKDLKPASPPATALKRPARQLPLLAPANKLPIGAAKPPPAAKLEQSPKLKAAPTATALVKSQPPVTKDLSTPPIQKPGPASAPNPPTPVTPARPVTLPLSKSLGALPLAKEAPRSASPPLSTQTLSPTHVGPSAAELTELLRLKTVECATLQARLQEQQAVAAKLGEKLERMRNDKNSLKARLRKLEPLTKQPSEGTADMKFLTSSASSSSSSSSSSLASTPASTACSSSSGGANSLTTEAAPLSEPVQPSPSRALISPSSSSAGIADEVASHVRQLHALLPRLTAETSELRRRLEQYDDIWRRFRLLLDPKGDMGISELSFEHAFLKFEG